MEKKSLVFFFPPDQFTGNSGLLTVLPVTARGESTSAVWHQKSRGGWLGFTRSGRFLWESHCRDCLHRTS